MTIFWKKRGKLFKEDILQGRIPDTNKGNTVNAEVKHGKKKFGPLRPKAANLKHSKITSFQPQGSNLSRYLSSLLVY